MKKFAFSMGLAVLAACVDQSSGPGVPSSFSIEDGAHNGGNAHFYFLPPMVPEPSVDGTFATGLDPEVSICALAAGSCAGASVAHFTTSTGSGSEVVKESTVDERYQVNWHTNEFELDEATTYRINVVVDGVMLGFADVDVVSSGKELKNVDTGEYIGLKDGRTLPIKFRIEDGALPAVLLGNVVDFDQHSADSMASLLFFTDAGAVYELAPADLSVGATLRTAAAPLGIVAVTSNRLDDSFVAITAAGDLYSFYASDNWAIPVAQGNVPATSPILDIAQQARAGAFRMIAGTADGQVFEIDPTFATAPVLRAASAYGSAVALTSNDRNNSFVMVTDGGDIYESFPASNWGTWQFRFDLHMTGAVDFHQIGLGNSDFPVIRADGGHICWWDPRNHHTCGTSTLPGNLVASGWIQGGRLKLASTLDGVLYTAHENTVVDWIMAGQLVP